MTLSHQQSLYVGYAVAALGWCVANRVWPRLWPKPSPPRFGRPWREVAYALAACAGVVAIGQFYDRMWKLSAVGSLAPVAGAVNQFLIFSPIGLLLLVRGQTLETAWVPRNRILTRVAIGVGLALIAVAAYCVVRGRFGETLSVLRGVFRFDRLEHMAQVFLEDVTIAVMMVRLSAALRRPWIAAVLVGALFAAGHVPTMVQHGAAAAELVRLIWDFALCAGVLMVAQRSADVWWLWCVHYAMDMTQF